MSDESVDSDVAAWLDEASAAPPGDFVDMLRRAQQLPEVHLSAQDLEDAEALPADEDELRARLNFGTLEDFLDDAAAFVAEQGHAEPPAPTWASPPTSGVGRWAVAAAAVVLMAAAGVLWLVLPSGAVGTQQEGPTPSAAADRSFSTDGDEARIVPPRPERVLPARDPEVEAPEPEVEAPEPEVEAPEPAARPRSGTGGASSVRPRRSAAELDAEAREAWRAGDLGRARRLFERVVARGGRTERSDVAYGDLFTLARRQGDTKALRRYWKRYVRRFPRGRYIDDARAGLCRAAHGDAQRKCWSAYLEARPSGTYRRDAEAALREP